MEIANPRRILFLGPPDSGILKLLEDLTGSAPDPLLIAPSSPTAPSSPRASATTSATAAATSADGPATSSPTSATPAPPPTSSIAGLSHTWVLRTPYYSATLPIWVDEVASAPSWRDDFLSPEASEVVRALGAWVYCFRKPVTGADMEGVRAGLRAVKAVLDEHGGGGGGWDGVCLAVAMPQSTAPRLAVEKEDWDEVCAECGFEFVDAEETERNRFGEVTGVARVREALEANDWTAEEDVGMDGLGELGEEEDGEESDEEFGKTFAAEEAEMSVELLGMKTAMRDEEFDGLGPPEDENEEARQVEELERMMVRMRAVKDMSEGMPDEERKRFAARAVNDIMKSF
ncbi:hypothetical protein BDY21DRAFT_121383 [Lineolata rhizophorae]|uniref:Alpha and gamma adaptin binding protein p34-domain-containing protein n=1 Tax=Lineolata rhizophorae TaxID=578093 RepID=A0A6A6NQ92_9PEZI|nr:hypothetical protein BDY21DRAFT_121383 [Lineolata rhizophorae]